MIKPNQFLLYWINQNYKGRLYFVSKKIFVNCVPSTSHLGFKNGVVGNSIWNKTKQHFSWQNDSHYNHVSRLRSCFRDHSCWEERGSYILPYSSVFCPECNTWHSRTWWWQHPCWRIVGLWHLRYLICQSWFTEHFENCLRDTLAVFYYYCLIFLILYRPILKSYNWDLRQHFYLKLWLCTIYQ